MGGKMGRTKFFKFQDKGKEDFEKHVKKLCYKFVMADKIRRLK
jgi:hypothetical protein